MINRVVILCLRILPFMMLSSQVNAAAFQLAEQNATGIGRAFAGEAAMGDNAAVLGRNPGGRYQLSSPGRT